MVEIGEIEKRISRVKMNTIIRLERIIEVGRILHLSFLQFFFDA